MYALRAELQVLHRVVARVAASKFHPPDTEIQVYPSAHGPRSREHALPGYRGRDPRRGPTPPTVIWCGCSWVAAAHAAAVTCRTRTPHWIRRGGAGRPSRLDLGYERRRPTSPRVAAGDASQQLPSAANSTRAL